MWKTNFHNRGQSLIGIIIVLVVVGLFGGGLYYYLSKQIPEVPEIPEVEVPEIVEGLEEEPIVEEPIIEEPVVEPEPELVVLKCVDGTPYGQCSVNKPKYCDNGKLVDRADLCGCPPGYKIYHQNQNLCITTSPPAYEPIIFALNKGYADKVPNWKQQADKVINAINSVFIKTTQKQFKISKYLTYNDSEYTNLFTSPKNYPEYYQDVGGRGGITFILLVHKDGISMQELKQFYGSDIVNVLYTVRKEGKSYPTILLAQRESFNILLDEYRPERMDSTIHEMGHVLGLAVPEWYFYKYSDCTGVDPKFSDYDIDEDPYFQNDPMTFPKDDINVLQFSELNSAIINKNLNLEYSYEDVRLNWFSKITKVYVTDKFGNPIQGATIKIFPIKKACFYCKTICKGVPYGHGVPTTPPPEQILTTDKNGYVTYIGPVGDWEMSETEYTPVVAKAIKVYYGGKSAVKVINFLDLQKSYVLDNSNEHIAHIILE